MTLRGAGVNLLLFVIWLALLALLALMWFNPPRVERLPVTLDADAGEAAGAVSALEALGPLDAYQEIVERPLFFQARRPPEPEPESKPEPSPEPEESDELTLIGVMQIGDSKTALIRNETTAKTTPVKAGEAFDERWTAMFIGPNTVTLARSNGETKQLNLVRNKRQPSAAISQQVDRLRQQRLLARQRREAAEQSGGGPGEVAEQQEEAQSEEELILQEQQRQLQDQLQQLQQQREQLRQEQAGAQDRDPAGRKLESATATPPPSPADINRQIQAAEAESGNAGQQPAQDN